MGTIRAKDIAHSDVLRLETEMNTLWGELNTANIPHSVRVETEQKLSGCEEQFRAVLGGQASLQELERKIKDLDMELAKAAILQAEHEIPKGERAEKSHLALENIKRELEEGKIKPTRARHEVKEIIRMRVM